MTDSKIEILEQLVRLRDDWVDNYDKHNESNRSLLSLLDSSFTSASVKPKVRYDYRCHAFVDDNSYADYHEKRTAWLNTYIIKIMKESDD